MRHTPNSAVVVGNEYNRHHNRGNESQKYGDAHDENQWRCCAFTVLGDTFETLHFGDWMVNESARFFPDLLSKKICAVPFIRRDAHVALLPVTVCGYTRPPFGCSRAAYECSGSICRTHPEHRTVRSG